MRRGWIYLGVMNAGRILGFCAALCAFSGCIDTETDIDLKPDGSASVHIQWVRFGPDDLGIPHSLVSSLSDAGSLDARATQSTNEGRIVDQVSGTLPSLEHFKPSFVPLFSLIKESDGVYEFKLSALPSTLAHDEQVVMSAGGWDGLARDMGKALIKSGDLAPLFQNASCSWSLKLPGQILATNGKTNNAGRIRWTLDIGDRVSKGSTVGGRAFDTPFFVRFKWPNAPPMAVLPLVPSEDAVSAAKRPWLRATVDRDLDGTINGPADQGQLSVFIKHATFTRRMTVKDDVWDRSTDVQLDFGFVWQGTNLSLTDMHATYRQEPSNADGTDVGLWTPILVDGCFVSYGSVSFGRSGTSTAASTFSPGELRVMMFGTNGAGVSFTNTYHAIFPEVQIP